MTGIEYTTTTLIEPVTYYGGSTTTGNGTVWVNPTWYSGTPTTLPLPLTEDDVERKVKEILKLDDTLAMVLMAEVAALKEEVKALKERLGDSL